MLLGVDDDYLEACLDPDPAPLGQKGKEDASGRAVGTRAGGEGDAGGPEKEAANEGEEQSESGSKPASPPLRDPATSSDKHGHSMSVAFVDDACPPKEGE